MAVPVSYPAWYSRRMPGMLERIRERVERIARASSPGIRLVLELLAAMLLRMEERRGHQADDRDRGEEHRPVRAASRGHRREGRSAGPGMQAERTEENPSGARKANPRAYFRGIIEGCRRCAHRPSPAASIPPS